MLARSGQWLDWSIRPIIILPTDHSFRPHVDPGSWHGFCMAASIFLKYCIQNLFFGKLFYSIEQLHTDYRPNQGRWIYDRGALGLQAANSWESSLYRKPLGTWWVTHGAPSLWEPPLIGSNHGHGRAWGDLNLTPNFRCLGSIAVS